MKKGLTEFSIRFPWVVIGIAVVVTAFFAAQFPKMKIDTDPENMLPADEPVRIFEHETKEKVQLKSSDQKALLVDWLSELLYLSDTKDVCYNKFDFEELTDEKLVAIAYGRRVKAKEDIKAVTYHGLEIKKTEEGWQAVILFDI